MNGKELTLHLQRMKVEDSARYQAMIEKRKITSKSKAHLARARAIKVHAEIKADPERMERRSTRLSEKRKAFLATRTSEQMDEWKESISVGQKKRYQRERELTMSDTKDSLASLTLTTDRLSAGSILVGDVVTISNGSIEVTCNPDWSQLTFWSTFVNQRNHKWWHDPVTGQKLDRNAGELIALMHSELSETLEGVRKSHPGQPLMSEKIPTMTSEEEEMADLFIRAMDYCGGRNLRIAEAIALKMEYNQTRADHQIENRMAPGGKKF